MKEKEEKERKSKVPNKVILIGKNICPICGKTFEATPPLEPNIVDREFYGGRIRFFKDVECDCSARYRLCIESKFNHKEVENELKVINMILLHEGKPLDELEKDRLEEKRLKDREESLARIEAAEKAREERDTLKARNELKKQRILATIVGKDEKLATLMAHTQHELQVMCKRRKIKFALKDNKQQLAETLLCYDEGMVVANPEG